MIKPNKMISPFQMFLIGSMIGNALFVGMGNIITVQIAKQNDWIVGWVCVVVGIIPILLFNKIIDYLPDLNIFEKNKKIFGLVIGQIINFIMAFIVVSILLINFWSVGNFATTKYLTETPLIFISFLFIIPTVYSSMKGIETIARTIQILFFFSLLIHFIITSSLLQFAKIDNIKPILAYGYTPLIRASLGFLSYCITPFLALLVIPKKTITNDKKLKKYFILGYMLAAAFMAHVLFMNMSVVGVALASLYRYPEYYIIKKVSIGGIFDNVENFLSIHWIFNIFSSMMICFFFVKEYISNIFKIEKGTIQNTILVILGLIITYASANIFLNSTVANNFMMYIFPLAYGLPTLIILFISCIVIIIKNHKNSQNIN